MKKLLGVLVALLVINTAYSQQAGKFRYQMDLGTAVPKDGGIGAIVNLEPQVLVRNNLALGMRVGVAGLAKDIVYYDIPDDYDGEIGANISVLGTANYYFNFGSGRVAPYIGAGFGYYSLSNLDIEESNYHDDDFENLTADFAWAPMIRAGVELNKFRIGVEYNFVPKSDLQNVRGDVIGQATNEYFAFTLGFFVGGGRWGRHLSAAAH
jgi:outer membrane protein W